MILSNTFSLAISASIQGSERLSDVAKALAPFVVDTLKWFRHQYEILLYASTILVAVGVIAEGFEVIHEHREKTGPFKIDRPEAPKWMVRAAFWGWLMVSVGVAGEFWFESWVSTKNEELEGISSALLGDAQLSASAATSESGRANERASANEKEAAQLRKDAAELEDSISWRRIPPAKRPSMAVPLKPYKRVVVWITYNMNDVEANDFAEDVGETLKLADWIPTDPEPIMRMFEGPVNFGTNRLLRGIVIRSNPGPETEKAAKALVRMLVDSGFDVTEGPTVPPGTSPIQALGVDAERASAGDFGKRAIVFVSVEPRPDGPQGDAKLRAMHEARNKKTNAKTP